MKTKNKRAWIRIVESAVAILMLASVILIAVSRQAERNNIADIMYKLQHAILEEASNNESMRQAVLQADTKNVTYFIKDRLPPGISFNITICPVVSQCTVPLPKQEIYVDDAIISSTFQQYQPRKLTFFAWIGGGAG